MRRNETVTPKTDGFESGNARIEILLTIIAALLVAIFAAVVLPTLDGATAEDPPVALAPVDDERPDDLGDALLAMMARGAERHAAMSPAERARAGRAAKESALESHLATMRQALELYAVQHDDAFPTDLVRAMTETTGVDGTPGTEYGPYIRNSFPTNPLSGDGRVRIVDAMPPAPVGPEGWVYATSDGSFRANLGGSSLDGTPYFDF